MTWPISALTFGSFQYLKREVGIYLELGANEASWTHEEQALVEMVVQRGIRRFYTPPILPGERHAHEWSFLRPLTTLQLSAPYDTGTVTVAAGVVTLAGGTFPSDAASGELEVNGFTYRVSTRDGDTQVTLEDTSVTAAAGSTYKLGYPQYNLPSDFSMFYGPMTYQPGNAIYPPIDIVSEHQIRARRQAADYYYRPTMAALRPRTLDATTGTRWEILLWPTPDDAYILDYRYRVNPADLTTVNLMPYGGDPHVATWVAAVLYESELETKLANGPRAQDFVQRLRASVDHDRRTSSPKFLGYGHDRSDKPYDNNRGIRTTHDYDSNIVTYEGISY